MKSFEPEFAGKMNFYLSAVNDLLILCRTNDRIVAEYALRDINTPIGISEYRLAESLPEKPKGSCLPGPKSCTMRTPGRSPAAKRKLWPQQTLEGFHPKWCRTSDAEH